MFHGFSGFFVETAGLGVSRADHGVGEVVIFSNILIFLGGILRSVVGDDFVGNAPKMDSAEDGFGFGNDGPSLGVA